jgi:hypothetical protein
MEQFGKIHSKILVRKPEAEKLIGRLRHKYENNIKMNLIEIGSVDHWILLAQDPRVIHLKSARLLPRNKIQITQTSY